VLSFLYIVAAVLLLAFNSPWLPSGRMPPDQMLLGWGGFGALSVLLGVLPLRLGLRRAACVEV